MEVFAARIVAATERLLSCGLRLESLASYTAADLSRLFEVDGDVAHAVEGEIAGRLEEKKHRMEMERVEALTALAIAENEKLKSEAAKTRAETETLGWTDLEGIIDSALPPIEDEISTTPSSTKSVDALIPTTVTAMVFKQLVHDFRDSSGHKQPDFVFRLTTLRHVLPPPLDAEREFSPGPAPRSGNVAIVGESKRGNLHEQGVDLVRRYNDGEGMVREVVCPLVGYMLRLRCKRGLLTTFKYTWVFYLDEDGSVQISEPFDSAAEKRDSTLNMIHYLLHTTLEESRKTCVKLVPRRKLVRLPRTQDVLPDVDEERDGSEDMSGDAKHVKHTGTPSDVGSGVGVVIKLKEQLQEHDDRVTWRALSNNGHTLVVKAYRFEQDRDLETSCYDLLQSMQGYFIPTLLERKYFLEQDPTRKYALVISWVGTVEKIHYSSRIKQKARDVSILRKARDIVVRMHDLGVAHGDVRLENMIYDSKTGKLFIYDFSHSATKRVLGASAFQKACQDELSLLDNEIQWSEAGEWRLKRQKHQSGPR